MFFFPELSSLGEICYTAVDNEYTKVTMIYRNTVLPFQSVYVTLKIVMKAGMGTTHL